MTRLKSNSSNAHHNKATAFIITYQSLQDDPEPSKCLGVFGLSLYTQERDLREVFSRYGTLDECNIVYDRQVMKPTVKKNDAQKQFKWIF